MLCNHFLSICLFLTNLAQVIFMQFSKAEKQLHQNNNFNPPPGYYGHEEPIVPKSTSISNTNFAKEQRFNEKQGVLAPGPGSYFNDKAERVRKRLLQEAKRKENYYKANNSSQSQIKISSIPSIPKKSSTRVYEQLAPGILILHEEQNEGSNVGPGSYNINYEGKHKKTIAYKINPEHKPKKQPEEPEVKIPTIAEQIRNQKRQLYKKNLIKATGLTKNIVSPSDLCLEVIILREKLLREEANPPPGYYYNENYQSIFKGPDPDLLPQYQLMMGKQKRFKEEEPKNNVGPGAYQIQIENKKVGGGYIAKSQVQDKSKKFIPGPGAYKVQANKVQPSNPKGNYPPIFGSGCNRFMERDSAVSETPGPGSYKVEKPKAKRQKYIKIKKNFYESQLVKPQNEQFYKNDLISTNGDRSRSQETSYFKNRHSDKNNHYFVSKVDRFLDSSKLHENIVGPGNYETNSSDILKQSFNRNQKTYTGPKQPRFDDIMIRPHLGPGAYYSGKSSYSTQK